MGITSLGFGCFVLVMSMIYYLLPFAFWKKCILLAANVIFYLSFQTQDIGYLVFVMVFTYFAGLLLQKKRHPALLWMSVIVVVSGLCFFKYANHFLHVEWVLRLLPEGKSSFVAPLGISFYTFKVLGYLIDIYQGKSKAEVSLLGYAVYISFFPQISSGPIQKASSFLDKLKQIGKMNYHVVRNGFQLMLFGLFEKMVIADRLLLIVEQCFEDLSIATPTAVVIGCVAYSFQIYADFDAYSNIANGLAGLFGFESTLNFCAPYLSRNIKEFWSRWHISLTSWLREYIYIPLGGNRKGILRKYINIMIVFLISGIWHGASLNFLLWGTLNGLLEIIHDFFATVLFKGKKLKIVLLDFMMMSIQIPTTFCIVTLLWVFFRCTNIEEIKLIFTLVMQFKTNEFLTFVVQWMTPETMVTMLMVLLLIGTDILRKEGFNVRHFGKLWFPLRWCMYVLMIIGVILFSVYGPGYDPSKFIYFEF